MKAVVLHAHGGLEQVVLEAHWKDPHPQAGQVVVRVRASSINRHDLFTIHGMPGIKLALPVVLGSDLSGEIAEIGPGVDNWKIGDRVLANPIWPGKGLLGELADGGFAEYCVVLVSQLIRLPANVDFETAACLPVAYGTAHRMMFTNGNVEPGKVVLVLGAAGGVGSCCVMLAKQAGCEVVACARGEDKLRRLKELGADHVVDYSREDFTKWVHARYGKPARRTDAGGVDVIVNYTGGESWVPSLRALKRGGKLLTCGASAGYDPKEDLRYVFMHELRIIGSNAQKDEDLIALLEMCGNRRLTPAIDRVLPLDQAQEALRLVEERECIGKVVIRI